MAIPFGQTLRVWRTHRGLTQQQLAQAAHVPRPNLCAMERGRREVSLSTLRALALALNVRPGALVDGVIPTLPGDAAGLSRQALERIADAVSQGIRLADPLEQALADLLRDVTTQRAHLAAHRAGSRRLRIRASEVAWLLLEAYCPPYILRTLIERIAERQPWHESKTN